MSSTPHLTRSATRAGFRSLSAILSAVGAAALLAPTAARAQTTPPADPRDSLPARAGTYALEAGLGTNSTTFGLLRFISPRAALGATLTAAYGHTSGDNGTSTSGGGGLSLGYRRYGQLRDRVGAFGTVGLTGSYSHFGDSQNGFQNTGNTATVGPFGELGATYLVARRLSVNASGQASVVAQFTRTTGTFQQPSGIDGTSVSTVVTRRNGYNASLGPVRLGITLFL